MKGCSLNAAGAVELWRGREERVEARRQVSGGELVVVGWWSWVGGRGLVVGVHGSKDLQR